MIQMSPLLGAAGASANVAGRKSGLMDLLSPLDYPRQALANAGHGLGQLVDEGDPSDLLRLLPAALGGIGGAMIGGPMGMLAGAGIMGGAQGLGRATGMEEFTTAPTAQEVAQSIGLDGNGLESALVGAATDPLSYVGIPMGGLGRGGAAAPVLGATPEQASLINSLGSADNLVAQDLLGMQGRMGRLSSETGLLQAAGDDFARAEDVATRLYDSRYGDIPGVTGPSLATDPASTVSELQRALGDPRMPFVEYTPQALGQVPDISQIGMNQIRAGAPEQQALLQALSDAGLLGATGVGPRGSISMLADPSAAGFMTRNKGGWYSMNPDAALPVAPGNPLQMGALPPEMARPANLPSLAEMYTTPMGKANGREAVDLAQYMRVNPSEIYTMRKELAGIGTPGAAGFQNVVDMPVDQGRAFLMNELASTQSQLGGLAERLAQMTPAEKAMFERLFPGVAPGSVPVGM